jgi:hypothetical protein
MTAIASFEGKEQALGAEFFQHELPAPACSGRKIAGTAYRRTDTRKGESLLSTVSPRSR